MNDVRHAGARIQPILLLVSALDRGTEFRQHFECERLQVAEELGVHAGTQRLPAFIVGTQGEMGVKCAFVTVDVDALDRGIETKRNSFDEREDCCILFLLHQSAKMGLRFCSESDDAGGENGGILLALPFASRSGTKPIDFVSDLIKGPRQNETAVQVRAARINIVREAARTHIMPALTPRF